MLIYLIIFAVLVFFSANEQYFRYSKFVEFRVLMVLMLLLFAALRPPGGDKDYVSYLISFSSFKEPLDYFKNYTEWIYFDPMYYLIPSFLKTYVSQNNYAIIAIFIYAIIALSLKFTAITRMSHFFFLTLLVYFSNFFLLHEMTQMRVGVTTAIFMMALSFLKDKNYKAYLLMVLMALLFHYSAILFLIPLIFDSTHFKKNWYWAMMGLILIMTFVKTDFILPLLRLDFGDVNFKSNNYIDYAEVGLLQETNKLNINFIMSYTITAALVLFIDKIQEKNNYAYLLVKLQILSLFLFQFFAPIAGFAFRFSELFLCTQIITIPFIVYIFRNRWLGYAIVVLIAAGYLWLNLFHQKLMLDYFKA